MAKFMALLMW